MSFMSFGLVVQGSGIRSLQDLRPSLDQTGGAAEEMPLLSESQMGL